MRLSAMQLSLPRLCRCYLKVLTSSACDAVGESHKIMLGKLYGDEVGVHQAGMSKTAQAARLMLRRISRRWVSERWFKIRCRLLSYAVYVACLGILYRLAHCRYADPVRASFILVSTMNLVLTLRGAGSSCRTSKKRKTFNVGAVDKSATWIRPLAPQAAPPMPLPQPGAPTGDQTEVF